MTTLTDCDLATCCATGLCGADIDQKPVDLAADLDWLKAQVPERPKRLNKEA